MLPGAFDFSADRYCCKSVWWRPSMWSIRGKYQSVTRLRRPRRRCICCI